MEQYISKSALVEEIEKAIDEPAPSHDQQCPWEDGYCCGLSKAENIIDTLEVKEVNLEKEVEAYMNVHNLHTQDGGRIVFENGDAPNFWCDFRDIAKHFFELGLKAQINIAVSNIDDVIRENGLDPDSKEAKVFKEAYYLAIDKAFEKIKKGE